MSRKSSLDQIRRPLPTAPRSRAIAVACLLAGFLLLLLAGGMRPLPARAQRGSTAMLLDAVGTPGGQILIQGHDFAPGARLTIVQHQVGELTSSPLLDLDSDRRGVIGPALAAIPADATPGDYELRALNSLGALAATAQLEVRPLPSVALDPAMGTPGTLVQVTVDNLIPGDLRLDLDGQAVLGPLPVAAATYQGSFVVPAGVAAAAVGDETLRVVAINRVGDRIAGRGVGEFLRRAPAPGPKYVVRELQTAATDLLPGATFSITGRLDPPPSQDPATYQIRPFWQDAEGHRLPIAAGGFSLAQTGEFQVAARLPSILRGDAMTAKPGGHFGASISGPDGAVSQVSPAQKVLSKFGAFRVVAVKDMPGDPQDGLPIPNTPQPGSGEPDPLQVTIEPVGVFSTGLASTLVLSGAEAILDVQAVLGALHVNEIKEKAIFKVDKFVNCIKWVDQASEIKWWEWVVDPWDTAILSSMNSVILDPAIASPQVVQPGVAAVQPALNSAHAALADTQEGATDTLFFLFRVTVDASRVVDGSQKGYGFVDGLNRAIPTETLFVWVPQQDRIFQVDEVAMTAVETSNPAPIRLPPLPEGWKSHLTIKEIDTGNGLVNPYNPDPTQPRYGDFFSFYRSQFSGNLNPAIQFVQIDPLRISVYLANHGSDATAVVPDVTIKLDGQSYPVIREEIPAEEPGPASCYSVNGQIPDTLAKFVWHANIPNPHKIPPGDHLLEIAVGDGLNTAETQQAILQFAPYPDWFDTLPLSNRQAQWNPFKIQLSAVALNPNQAKTNVTDQIDELDDPNSQVNVGSAFVCTIDRGSVGLQTQTGDMNSDALDNPAQTQNFSEFSYCASPFDLQAASVLPEANAQNRYAGSEGAQGADHGIEVAKTAATHGETTVTILDTGKIRVFEAKYGVPGIATVGIAVDFRVYATSLINDTVTAGIHVDFDSGVQVDIYIEADILLGLASVDFGFASDIGVAIPVGFTWAGGIQEPEKCFHYALDLFYDIDVLWGAIDVSDGTYNIFEGDEPNNCYNFLHAAGMTQGNGPPASNPAIATDGFGQTMALWRTEDGHIVYSLYNGGSWSAEASVVANGKSGDPAIAFFAPNQAVAVWSQSGLAVSPGPTITALQIPVILASQHLAYAVWDGVSWSAPADLTLPTTGDGKVALAACEATDVDCPTGGEVTAVWVHDDAGDVSQRHFRIQTATFANNAWSVSTTVNSGSTAAETEPAVVYVGGQPLAVWVSDADRQAATVADRTLALRFLDGSPVQAPAGLPTGVLNPDLTVDSQGDVQMAFTVVDAQDGLITNRRRLYRGKGSCGGNTTCTWAAQPLQDPLGRSIFAEQPVVTVDENDLVTLTYRALGYDPATSPQTPVSPVAEPLGIVQHTGELAQLNLPAAFGSSSTPAYLTGDGAVNWRAAAAYVPPLQTTVALAVKGPAPLPTLAASALAQETVDRTEPVLPGQPVIFAGLTQLPNFAVGSLTAGEPSATGAISVTVTILNTGVDWPVAEDGGDPGILTVEAFWDDTVWTGDPAASTAQSTLAAGQSVEMILPLAPPAQEPGAEHNVTVVANRGQPLAEQTALDNSRNVTVAGLAPPEQARGFTEAGQRLAFLEWQPPADTRVVGYRVYRVQNGEIQIAGTTFVPGWFDAGVQWEETVRYAVRSFDAAFAESRDSDVVSLTIPTRPVRETHVSNVDLYLPLVGK